VSRRLSSRRPPEPLAFELSRPGRAGWSLPALPAEAPEIPVEKELLRTEAPALPELSEVEVVRHFTRLSELNYGVDDGLFPLGSCTMKHNPRVNEAAARLPGFAQVHPLQPESTTQGALAVLHGLETLLAEITGMDAVSLQPAAGAHGELTGMMMIRALLESRGDARGVVLIPDSAHGTNPASAHFCGYRPEEIPSTSSGRVDVKALEERLGEDVAAIMLTNPNTLGVFEDEIARICSLCHRAGALVYCDGANMNAMLGLTRPGDQGIDVMHLNLHKTFTTPHGGGGPGSGPVAVRGELADYLPAPRVVLEEGVFRLRHDLPRSIGRVRSFHGNFGMVVRAYAYIREMGAEGLRRAAEGAILNANYLRARLSRTFALPYSTPTLHEVVFSDRDIEKRTGVKALDLAKRLIDYGFHPPTVYFPLVVPGAIMVEPTETESREELDAFVEALLAVVREAETEPETVRTAPHRAPVRRLDEVGAARHPVLRWSPESED
jgi:glycine dehydrogenase subunit 2